MVLYIGPDGRVVDGPLPAGATTKVLALGPNGVTEVFVISGSGGSGGWTDEYAFAVGLGVADTMAAPTDTYAAFADATYADTNATPTEALQVEAIGPADTNATPTDAKTSLIVRYATTSTTGGTTVPTNPTNAHGANNGTVATCKAGGVANGTSILGVTIATPMSEIPAGSTRTFRAYYAFTAGTGDTCTASLAYRQVGGAADTVVALPATGNFLTTGTPLTLTNINPAVSAVVTFTHTASAPATGGQVTVDAVGIETTGAL